jgi:hypothetical protein
MLGHDGLQGCITAFYVEGQMTPFNANTALTTVATTAVNSKTSGSDSPNSSRGPAKTLAAGRDSLRPRVRALMSTPPSDEFSECFKYSPITEYFWFHGVHNGTL